MPKNPASLAFVFCSATTTAYNLASIDLGCWWRLTDWGLGRQNRTIRVFTLEPGYHFLLKSDGDPDFKRGSIDKMGTHTLPEWAAFIAIATK